MKRKIRSVDTARGCSRLLRRVAIKLPAYWQARVELFADSWDEVIVLAMEREHLRLVKK